MLPEFRYHPNPVATGNVKSSTTICACCQQARGYIYVGSLYGPELRSKLCPWCIADGKAAARFDVFFSVEDTFVEAKIPRQTIIEVTRRTPGYISWQQEVWQTCCGDACEFHGDATTEELHLLEGTALTRLLNSWQISTERWNNILKIYVPGGGITIFRFVCRVCGQTTYTPDLA